jgi:hypothetical protein
MGAAGGATHSAHTDATATGQGNTMAIESGVVTVETLSKQRVWPSTLSLEVPGPGRGTASAAAAVQPNTHMP